MKAKKAVRYYVIRKPKGMWETKTVTRGEVSDRVFFNECFESKELALEKFAEHINKLYNELNLLMTNLNHDKTLPLGILFKEDILSKLSAAMKTMTKIINSEKIPMDQRTFIRANRTEVREIIKKLTHKEIVHLDSAEMVKYRRHYVQRKLPIKERKV